MKKKWFHWWNFKIFFPRCLNNTVKDDKGKCVPSQCYPNPCVNGECHVLNGASNFTCICYGIWTGPLCNQVSSVNIAGLSWWWILLVVLLLLAICESRSIFFFNQTCIYVGTCELLKSIRHIYIYIIRNHAT